MAKKIAKYNPFSKDTTKDKNQDQTNDEPAPKSEDEWVTLVNQRIEDGTNWVERRQMMINLNYFVGNQWISWDKNRNQVVAFPNPNNEERVTHNKIRPRVMTKLAKQTKNRIKYDVTPDGTQQERIETAKASSKFIAYWWQDEEMDRKTRDIFLNNDVKGWCAAKVYFNASAGDDITPDPEEMNEKDNDMDEMVEGKSNKSMSKVFTGEIECRICDPLTLFVDPSATCDEEIRWIVEEKPRDVDYVYQMYGKNVAPDETVTYLSNFDITQQNSNGLNTNSTKKNKNMVMVREMWVFPCAKYPNGLKVCCTKSDLLDIDEKAGENPYIIFGDIPIPGSVKYEAFIKDMLPVQREINIMRTMMATHAKRMGSSKWMLPMGANVDEEQLDDEIGGFIYYNASAGGAPVRAEPPNIPNFYDRILELGSQDIDDMSGAREISQGRLPAGLDTASGLSLMVEQENEKLAVSSQNYERGMKKLLQRVLILMKKHYTEERMGRILGEDNEVEVVYFTGSDLTGGEDITIVQGSSLPEMKSAQEDRIMTLWQQGAIVKRDGTPDADTFLRMMGMGDSTELFEQHLLDENKAKMENKVFSEMMEQQQIGQMFLQYQQQKQMVDQHNQQIQMEAQNQGISPDAVQQFIQPPPPPPQGMPVVRDFYDHDVHIYYHNNFRKSSEYDELPPELQAIVDDHVNQHEQMQQQNPSPQAQMANQQAQAAQAQADAQQQKNQIAAQQVQQRQAQADQQTQLGMAKIQAENNKTKAQLTHAILQNQQNHEQSLIEGQQNHAQSLIQARLDHSHQLQRDQLAHAASLQSQAMKPSGGGGANEH